MTAQLLRVGYVPGVTPDRWARSWRERRDGVRLDLVPVAEDDAEAAVRGGRLDMAIVRLPVDRSGLHLVRLYDEVTVVVVSSEHPVAAYDEIELADLSGEQLIATVGVGSRSDLEQRDVPAMSAEEAVAVAASGSGVVLLPMSVARLHHRRDAVHRPVRDLPLTPVALIWQIDRDDDTTQAFVGVTRGRTPRSSRG